MTTIKLYSDLQQSKKLTEILPLESADMWWVALNWQETEYYVEVKQDGINQPKKAIPCWSLASLLKYLSEINPQVYTPVLFPSEGKWILQFVEYGHGNIYEAISENPIDVCVVIVEKLKELNLI